MSFYLKSDKLGDILIQLHVLYYSIMKRLNILLSLYSLLALIIITERLLPATRVLLQPYDFIRLHEINQTVLFLTATVILSFFTLLLLTNNFKTIQSKAGILLAVLFIVGVYLYGAGEGWHEVASFTLNQYCSIKKITGNLCGGLFINDFYAGNIIFFIGGVFMNISLMGFAVMQPIKNWTNKDMSILLVNSLVYAFTWFAYAAFDTVSVGLLFSAILTFISIGFLVRIKNQFRKYPYITYSALAYSLATLATILVRFH